MQSLIDSTTPGNNKWISEDAARWFRRSERKCDANEMHLHITFPTVVGSSESCRNEPPKKLKTTETPKKCPYMYLNTIPLKEYTYIFLCPLFWLSFFFRYVEFLFFFDRLWSLPAPSLDGRSTWLLVRWKGNAILYISWKKSHFFGAPLATRNPP